MPKSKIPSETLRAYALIFLGCCVGALGYPLFMTPNNIAPGGLTGLATVLHYLIPSIPVGISSLVMNIPLFFIGYRAMGRTFVQRSLVASVAFSLLIDLFTLAFPEPLTRDPLLSCVFGGVLLGAGLGLVFRGGATTGGTDMAARMVHHHFPLVTVGSTLFAIDCISVLLSGIFIDVPTALYAFICIFVSDKVVDAVVMGLHREKACYVISQKQEELKTALMSTLERGVTLLEAQGGYSGEPRPVVLCVISSQEVARFKALVRAIDPSAFMFITEAHEVLGEGFQPLAGSQD